MVFKLKQPPFPESDRTLLLICLSYLLIIFVTMPARADDMRPLYIELQEQRESIYAVQLKTPPSIPAFNQPHLVLPEYCVEIGIQQAGSRPYSIGEVKRYQCKRSLAGAPIRLEYPVRIPPVSGVMKLTFVSGETYTLLTGRGETAIVLPTRETSSQVISDYTWLGMHHIWVGYDHLLFLLCLIWIAGSLRRILITITGFTLAHSITLVLSALEIVKLPIPPIEAVIALSVLFLAVEVAKGRRENLTWRYPVTVSSAFGLLHGLGFAAVLNDIGLPQTELMTGLVAFNIGVEIGQIAFAIVVIFLLSLLQRVIAYEHFERHMQLSMGYVVGCIAAYWLAERTWGFVV